MTSQSHWEIALGALLILGYRTFPLTRWLKSPLWYWFRKKPLSFRTIPVHCISFSYSRLYWSFHTLILRRVPAVSTSRNLAIAGADALRKHSSFDNLLSVAVEACFMQRGVMAIYISWSLQAVLAAFLPGRARSFVLEVRHAKIYIQMQHTRS